MLAGELWRLLMISGRTSMSARVTPVGDGGVRHGLALEKISMAGVGFDPLDGHDVISPRSLHTTLLPKLGRGVSSQEAVKRGVGALPLLRCLLRRSLISVS